MRIAGTLLAALIISSCEEYPTPYQPGLYPRAAPAGWWNDEGASGKPRIIVHIGEQKAYFYKGKTLVGETTVSTGKPGFSTPPGHYTVLSKMRITSRACSAIMWMITEMSLGQTSTHERIRRPKGSHFDGARMPYAMFFRGGYAMHQGYVPPFAASHGCIRIPGQMAATFYENAPVGTPVTVTE